MYNPQWSAAAGSIIVLDEEDYPNPVKPGKSNLCTVCCKLVALETCANSYTADRNA